MRHTICLFGDSITWGGGDEEKGGWGLRLRFFLESNDYDTRIYNCGVCGDNSAGLLKRFKTECDAREPDIILLSIGTNDSQFVKSRNSKAVLIENYEDNLDSIVKLAKERTETVIILGLTNIDEEKTTPAVFNPDKYYYKESIEQYNEKAKEISLKNGCLFIDMLDLHDNSDFIDGLHPNSTGHNKLFLRIKEFILSNNIL